MTCPYSDMVPIPEHPKYYINPEGQVWSDKTKKFLSVKPDSAGYNRVMLYNKKLCYRLISKLLLLTFDRPPLPGEVCRHLNDIKKDNRLCNLAWGTHQDNMNDKALNDHQTKQPGETNGNAKLFPLDVINILQLCGETQYNQKRIAKIYGVASSNISDINTGRSWKHIYKIWKEEN